jgi:hypothetical protein
MLAIQHQIARQRSIKFEYLSQTRLFNGPGMVATEEFHLKRKRVAIHVQQKPRVMPKVGGLLKMSLRRGVKPLPSVL